VAGQRERAGARHARRLDEQHVAAAGVQARPIATPGSFVRSSISSSRKRRRAEHLDHDVGRDDDRVASSPSARRRATLRQSAPISRSRLRTPASRV
jgi:hypothetical protein